MSPHTHSDMSPHTHTHPSSRTYTLTHSLTHTSSHTLTRSLTHDTPSHTYLLTHPHTYWLFSVHIIVRVSEQRVRKARLQLVSGKEWGLLYRLAGRNSEASHDTSRPHPPGLAVYRVSTKECNLSNVIPVQKHCVLSWTPGICGFSSLGSISFLPPLWQES